MARPRVTVSMRKELRELRARGHGGRGGVMVVPRILSVDEFERIASVSQDALIASAYDDRLVAEQPAPYTPPPDPSIESERDDQEKLKQAALGGLDYVREREKQLRRMTTR